MATKIVKAVIKLRRDNDYNYAKVSESFIPAFGEVCLVDTARSGLMVVVGDGVTPYGQLRYANNVFVKAYYNKEDGKFYDDSSFINAIVGNTNKIYIDLNNTNRIYYYNGADYINIGAGEIPRATAEIAGIMKLYNEKGNNTDGAISQLTFTTEINKKVEMEIEPENENIIFGYNLS